MSKWIIDPVVIYSPSSGETIATAWQKQIKIDDDLLAMINRLRTMDASAGSNVSDAEAFQLKINTTDKTLLIRNATNTEWIVCGYVDKEFLGITPETIYAIKNNGGVNSIKIVQDVPSGGNNGDLALDINNKKLYQKNDGIWSLLLSLSAIDLLDYNNLIKNNNGDIGKISIVNSLPYGGENGDIAIDITNKKMYYKQNNNWNIALSLHASDLVDYSDIILEEDVSPTAEANKIPRADDSGKLPNDIAGSPDKLANKTIIANGLKDGMVFVYRSSANDGDGGFVPEGVTPSSFIDDGEISLSKTYSSSKIENSINELLKTTNDSLFNYTRTRKNSFMYKVGDIVYLPNLFSYMRLECFQEGTTAESVPEEFNTVKVGQYITDGTVKWIICDVKDGLSLGDVTYRPILKEGYVKLNGATVQRADYPRLVQYATDNNLWTSSPMTEVWKFGNGDGSSTFVLPDYRNRIIQGSDTPSKIEAGLPDIQGSFYANDLSSLFWTGAKQAAGAFSLNTTQKNVFSGGTITLLPTISAILFNASNYNAIYGNSTTVQPPAIKLIPQIKY